MKRSTILRFAGALAAMIAVLPGGSTPVRAAASANDRHLLAFSGISTLGSGCEYEWHDGNTATSQIEPVRDDVNIPRPKMSIVGYTDPATGQARSWLSAPTCRDGNGSANSGTPVVPCFLTSNTGAYPPYNPVTGQTLSRAANEIGLYPPCYFPTVTSSDLAGEQGCQDVWVRADGTAGRGPCNINTPSWLYGYCSQTIGGAEGGSLLLGDGSRWRIDRLGFSRGRGTWEVSGRLTLLDAGGAPTNQHTVYRNFVNGVVNRPEQAAGCVANTVVSSVYIAGVYLQSGWPVKVLRPRPGFHWCADDPVLQPLTNALFPPVPGTSLEGC